MLAIDAGYVRQLFLAYPEAIPASADPRSALAARIERLRNDRGLTVVGLAERAELDRRQVDAVLDGTSDVGISVFLKLAGALDVKIEELVDGIRWVPGPSGGKYQDAGPPDG